MLKKQIYAVILFVVLGCMSCGDDDNNLGPLSEVDFLSFEFPQGNNAWDKEIEQIAKDWGMYIIYKDVDSTHLSRSLTTSTANSPVYTCETPGDEDIQFYLGLVKEWMLESLDKTKKEDLKGLPYYLYLVNNYKYTNPAGEDVHVMLNKNGWNYWSLSFTTEELANGIGTELIHTVACAFSYPGLKNRFLSGEYVVAPGFEYMSDYESEIGTRYYPFEDFLEENPWIEQYYPEEADQRAQYEMMTEFSQHELDPYNAYQRRGFAPEVTENFKLVEYPPSYGAPTWMPWLPFAKGYDMTQNPNEANIPDVPGRVVQDFLNMIRLAMTFSESTIREKFPVDVDDPLVQYGNMTINDKYDIVVSYMKDTYDVDLQKYAAILDGE
jgi:hypothetical protein